MAPSEFRGLDLYQTTYSTDHRPYDRNEQLANAIWTRERKTRPWLQEPVTDFKLQVKEFETYIFLFFKFFTFQNQSNEYTYCKYCFMFQK